VMHNYSHAKRNDLRISIGYTSNLPALCTTRTTAMWNVLLDVSLIS